RTFSVNFPRLADPPPSQTTTSRSNMMSVTLQPTGSQNYHDSHNVRFPNHRGLQQTLN
ncbi:hypothetical protein PTTG_30472, partial [Puccinia triticina 1-1 BBBD Race 1]